MTYKPFRFLPLSSLLLSVLYCKRKQIRIPGLPVGTTKSYTHLSSKGYLRQKGWHVLNPTFLSIVRECGFCHIILVKWSNENSIQLPTLKVKQCVRIVCSLTCSNMECGLPLCWIHIHFQNFICWTLREATGFRVYCWVKFMYCGERTNPISSLFSVNCTYALPLALWSLYISRKCF